MHHGSGFGRRRRRERKIVRVDLPDYDNPCKPTVPESGTDLHKRFCRWRDEENAPLPSKEDKDGEGDAIANSGAVITAMVEGIVQAPGTEKFRGTFVKGKSNGGELVAEFPAPGESEISRRKAEIALQNLGHLEIGDFTSYQDEFLPAIIEFETTVTEVAFNVQQWHNTPIGSHPVDSFGSFGGAASSGGRGGWDQRSLAKRGSCSWCMCNWHTLCVPTGAHSGPCNQCPCH